MTADSRLAFPGSRTLAGWWKSFASLQPRALWVGHLLLHGIEALVEQQMSERLEDLVWFVLRALNVDARATLDTVENHLHLGRPLLAQLLRRLEREKLVGSRESGAWSLTALGRQAAETGSCPRSRFARRRFYFVESHQLGRPPTYVNLLDASTAVPWAAPEDWRFPIECLTDALREPPEWKYQQGFPLEVLQLVQLSESATLPPAWQRVVLDRPERMLVAVVRTRAAEGGERLLGYAIQQQGWSLKIAEPAFVIPGTWQKQLPDLEEEPTAKAWRQAWRVWCQPRGLVSADVEACGVSCHECCLRVVAPSRLIDRLRVCRSDALKSEAWVLAGEGRWRAAALIELTEAAGGGIGAQSARRT
jgi:hypothetical protein